MTKFTKCSRQVPSANSGLMAFVFCHFSVHVRRTDKVGTEAAFHSIEEYMFHVEEWFKLYEKIKPVDRRRVYLATDDPSVLADARKK